MSISIQFTIFTPVYNRRHTIDRVWKSLKSQTYKNFEWVVVDDGSTDGVWDLLEEYEKEADFPVVLLQQQNKGKHVAWNRAVKLAKGELFVPADSDDSFEPNTLERFAFHWENSISKQERKQYSGINVLCKDPYTDQIVGAPYPSNLLISNNLELYFKYKIDGEKWGCIRTDVLKKRPFKEVKGAFLSENYIWFYIARQYKVLCVNEGLRHYYTDDEMCLSKPKPVDLIRSAESRYLSALWNLDTNMDYIIKYKGITYISKEFSKVWRFGLLADIPVNKIIAEFKNPLSKLLLILYFVPSYIYYLLTFKRLKDSRTKLSVQP